MRTRTPRRSSLNWGRLVMRIGKRRPRLWNESAGAALAALRNARDSHDPEVRTRAGILAQKIESALLTQPTRFVLDFQNTPLPEVARALSLQSGFRIELYPSNLPKWARQRVTLTESGPVDFWKAIDQLCDLTGLQYNESMRGYVGPERADLRVDGSDEPHADSDFGPWSVPCELVQHRLSAPSQLRPQCAPAGSFRPHPGRSTLQPAQREKAPSRLNPMTNVQFAAQLRVAAEPRLALGQPRRLELVEAVDDRGNSLIPAGENDLVQNRHAGYFGTMTGPVIQLQAQLHRPEAAGQRIKKLRGFIPLTVSSRRPHPLVISLNKAAGKTVENQDHRLTVHDIQPTPNNHNVSVELSITANDPDAILRSGTGGRL